MMNNPISSLVISFSLLIFTCLRETTTKADNADAKKKLKKLMVYSYRHGFSGFAAKLTYSQAKQIEDDNGHGTHVAYTAAGSYINNVKYHGVNMGTTRGGAPLARKMATESQMHDDIAS
ncbi:hypothetical protein P3S68_013478 [Capsicum galapagoense]